MKQTTKNEDGSFQVIDLIRKFQNSTISPEENKALHEWVNKSERNALLFEQLNSENYRSDALLQMSSYDTEAALERVNERLRRQEISNESATGNIKKLAFRIAAVAASLFLASLIFFNREKLGSWINPAHEQTVATKIGERKFIRLPDGSQVWLSPASALSFPDRFNAKNREITLQGEAFFEVTKDKTHPFLIHSGAMLTRVVGTSFNVHAYTNQNVATVAVLTGIVSVSELTTAHKMGQQVRVKPFEEAVFDKYSHRVTAQPYPKAKDLLLRRQGIYHYEGTPVLQIIEDLQKNYNVHIEVAGDLHNCTFYGDVSSQDDIYKFLRKVCITINAQIERNGNTIIITSSGC